MSKHKNINIIDDNNPIPTKNITRNNRTNIPQVHRSIIWNEYVGIQVGQTKCLCCDEYLISQLQFHIGHIIPRSLGGTMCRENLRPICSQCNLSMGNENMLNFMKRLNYDTKRILEKPIPVLEPVQAPEPIVIVEKKIKIKCAMRNNQWGKHVNVFDTICHTKKIISPWGHWSDTNKLFEEGKFNNMRFSNIFINNLEINDHVLMLDREYAYALILKITSVPIAEKCSEILILRKMKCNHKPIIQNCKREKYGI